MADSINRVDAEQLSKYQQVIKNVELGSELNASVEAVGMSLYEFKKWLNENPDEKRLLHDIIDARSYRIEDKLYQMAAGGNLKAMMFFLKNRSSQRWKDRVVVDTDDTKPVPVGFDFVPVTKAE